jgi:hypothetical protein
MTEMLPGVRVIEFAAFRTAVPDTIPVFPVPEEPVEYTVTTVPKAARFRQHSTRNR